MSSSQNALARELIGDHKVLMVTGKGGIGKTVVSTCLAQLATQLGRRVCLIESRVDDQIAPLLGLSPVGHELRRVNDRLSIINLNATANFRDFIVKHLGYERLFERVFDTTMVRSFIRMLPGVAELTLLGRLYYMAQLSPEKFDLVIFDGFASGHFLNLLTTPKAIVHSGLSGPVVNETQTVIDFFNQPGNSAIIQVATAEELVLSELKEFLPKMVVAELSTVSTIILNRFASDKALPKTCEDHLRGCLDFVRDQYDSYADRADELRLWIDAQKLGHIKLRTLPDLGLLDEPFTPTFAQEFFAESTSL
jgi:arsenite-transporting ATPase